MRQIESASASVSRGAKSSNGYVYTVTFDGATNKGDLALMTCAKTGTSSTLGGSSPGCNVAQTTQGVDGPGTSGTFKLAFGSGAAHTTSALSSSASAAQVKAALDLLPDIGSVDVTVGGATNGGYVWTITFDGTSATGADSAADVNMLTCEAGTLLPRPPHVGAASCVVAESVKGVGGDVQTALNSLSTVNGASVARGAKNNGGYEWTVTFDSFTAAGVAAGDIGFISCVKTGTGSTLGGTSPACLVSAPVSGAAPTCTVAETTKGALSPHCELCPSGNCCSGTYVCCPAGYTKTAIAGKCALTADNAQLCALVLSSSSTAVSMALICGLLGSLSLSGGPPSFVLSRSARYRGGTPTTTRAAAAADGGSEEKWFANQTLDHSTNNQRRAASVWRQRYFEDLSLWRVH